MDPTVATAASRRETLRSTPFFGDFALATDGRTDAGREYVSTLDNNGYSNTVLYSGYHVPD